MEGTGRPYRPRIIMTTALADETNVIRGHQGQLNDCLGKPVQEKLLEELRKLELITC